MRRGAILVLVGALALPAAADVCVSRVFTDNMVLPRDCEVPVWGRGTRPGEAVEVTFGTFRASGKVGSDGRWEVCLPCLAAACLGRELEIQAKNRIVLKNVVVGDVILVAGQSNAEFQMARDFAFAAAKEDSSRFSSIRATKVAHVTSSIPNVGDPPNAPWTVADADHLGNVTAVGYWMARELFKQTGVPVGLIDDNWGGSRIEPFVCEDALSASPDNEAALEMCRENRRREILFARQVVEYEQTGRFHAKGGFPQKTDWAIRYNAMVEPFVRFPVSAVVWYQGCANSGEREKYASKLEMLITGWRKKWGRDDLPFYVVQLAGYNPLGDPSTPAGGEGFAGLREAQRRVAERVQGVGLVTAFDVGNATDIHPRNKLDVGLRLARWALRDLYGRKDVVTSGPRFRVCSPEVGALRVAFDDVASGLIAARKDPDTTALEFLTKETLEGFSVAGADRKWRRATARIDGKTVVVSSPEVSHPVAVRYAYQANPMGAADLYNRAGLPAVPFKSDNWD